MGRLNAPYIVLASRLLGVMLSLISAPILARALGPEGRGATAAAIAALTLLPVLVGLGLPLVIRRRAVADAGLNATVRTVRLLALASLVPSALVGALLALTTLASVETTAIIVFCIACAATPITVLWICNANILIAQNRLFAYSLVSIFPGIVYVLAITIGWATGVISVPYVIAANFAGSIACFIFTSALVRIPIRGERARWRPLLKEGFSFAGSQLAESASYRLDQVVALPIIGGAQAGFYAVAATVAMLPYAVGQSIGTAVFREVAREEGQDQRRWLIAKAVRLSALVAIVVTILLAVVTPWAVPFIFGDQFAPAVPVVLIALIGSVAVAVGYVCSSVLTAVGKGWAMTASQVAGLVIGMLLLVLLGPAWGAVAAAGASAAGYLVTSVSMNIVAGVRLGDWTPRRGDLKAAIRLVLRGKLA